jgi:hypothetical protein
MSKTVKKLYSNALLQSLTTAMSSTLCFLETQPTSSRAQNTRWNQVPLFTPCEIKNLNLLLLVHDPSSPTKLNPMLNLAPNEAPEGLEYTRGFQKQSL